MVQAVGEAKVLEDGWVDPPASTPADAFGGGWGDLYQRGGPRCDLTLPGENPECASGHMSGAVVDLVCSDQLS